MRKTPVALLLFLAVLLVFQACSTVPVTGRKQFALLPDSQLLSMSLDQYGQFLRENKLSADAAQTDMVKRVGRRIQAAVEMYFAQHNLSRELKAYAWEFNLVEHKDVNAWCMPGGKVVVYTGILPFTQNENGLAVVMGHEIAHAVARHGNERMSQLLVAQLGGLALNEALSQKPQQTRSLWMNAFGAGVQVGALLPFSRLQENEADRLGLIFMAMAGYDPNGAVVFWQRMSQKAGGKPPEFLSTHPADETRIRKIRAGLPEALTYYRKPK
ncbi:MAG: peptidase M48 [Candidatus Aminicenantes bacterium RBG_16_63_16]|nr:MAG: peptidase M48 [Candidatus Aminicenantes bacterium RBG_16_63_16]